MNGRLGLHSDESRGSDSAVQSAVRSAAKKVGLRDPLRAAGSVESRDQQLVARSAGRTAVKKAQSLVGWRDHWSATHLVEP